MLPILTDCSGSERFLTGYIGTPSWADDAIRISFTATSAGNLGVFVHAFGTTQNVEVLRYT